MEGLFRPGGGAAEGQGERGGEKEVFNHGGGEFSKVDIPDPHPFQLVQRVGPEAVERLPRVVRAVAQGVEPGVKQPGF